MSALYTQLGPLLFILLPAVVLWALRGRYQQMHHAQRLGLVSDKAWRYLRWGLLFCCGFWLFTFISLFWESALWPPLLAVLTILAMVLLMRTAREGVNPGLHGFHWPFPKDGIALIERDRQLAGRRPPLRWWIRRLAPIAPAAILLLLLTNFVEEDGRRLLWLLAMLGFLAPTLLIPYHNAWLSPFLLLVVSGFLLWQAVNLRSRLPPGSWSTPWTAAQCSAQVALTEEGTAWCPDVSSGIVYQFHLPTGFVLDQYEAPGAWEIIAANHEGAWFGGQTASKFSYVGSGEAKEQDVSTLINGALGAGNAFWFLDGTRRLHVYDGQKSPERLSMEDGLLEDTALVVKALPDQSVWVGSSKGVSRRDPASGKWQSFGRGDGVQGAVIDITAAPDGAVWLLNYMLLNRNVWWASAYDSEGEWRHISLSRLTGLSAPRGRDAIAVDGLGRLWFVALSISGREKFLGVLNADGTLAYPLYSLGPYPTDGPFFEFGKGTRPGPFGVLSDGDGGIYLYNGHREPLRHWNP